MDDKTRKLMSYLLRAIAHRDASGFEMLEFLDMRSRLAAREPLLEQSEKQQLEDLDRMFLKGADFWLSRIAEVADLAEMRQRQHVLPSHWWWYLDEVVSSRRRTVGE